MTRRGGKPWRRVGGKVVLPASQEMEGGHEAELQRRRERVVTLGSREFWFWSPRQARENELEHDQSWGSGLTCLGPT